MFPTLTLNQFYTMAHITYLTWILSFQIFLVTPEWKAHYCAGQVRVT